VINDELLALRIRCHVDAKYWVPIARTPPRKYAGEAFPEVAHDPLNSHQLGSTGLRNMPDESMPPQFHLTTACVWPPGLRSRPSGTLPTPSAARPEPLTTAAKAAANRTTVFPASKGL